MDFIDICAGIGGFRNGLEQAGHRCVGYVEIDKYARASYEQMYDTSEEWTATDVTRINPNDVPKADLWCFGFPCQDISVAGNQKGLGGTRSGIFYSIIEIIKGQSPENKPEWIFVENVKNLLSINGGRDFTEVLYQMAEGGGMISNFKFSIPKTLASPKTANACSLSDILETDVPDTYYLTQERVDKLIEMDAKKKRKK